MSLEYVEHMIEEALRLEEKEEWQPALEKYTALPEILRDMEIKARDENERRKILSLLSFCHMRIGTIYLSLNQMGKAEKHIRVSSTHAEESKDPLTIARITLALGALHHKKGDLGEAEKLMRRAKALFESRMNIEYQKGLGWCMINPASLQAEKGHLQQSITHFFKAVEVLRSINNYVGIAMAYDALAKIHKRMESIELANKYSIESMKYRKYVK